jgi:hypothetical protein
MSRPQLLTWLFPTDRRIKYQWSWKPGKLSIRQNTERLSANIRNKTRMIISSVNSSALWQTTKSLEHVG